MNSRNSADAATANNHERQGHAAHGPRRPARRPRTGARSTRRRTSRRSRRRFPRLGRVTGRRSPQVRRLRPAVPRGRQDPGYREERHAPPSRGPRLRGSERPHPASRRGDQPNRLSRATDDLHGHGGPGVARSRSSRKLPHTRREFPHHLDSFFGSRRVGEIVARLIPEAVDPHTPLLTPGGAFLERVTHGLEFRPALATDKPPAPTGGKGGRPGELRSAPTRNRTWNLLIKRRPG